MYYISSIEYEMWEIYENNDYLENLFSKMKTMES